MTVVLIFTVEVVLERFWRFVVVERKLASMAPISYRDQVLKRS